MSVSWIPTIIINILYMHYKFVIVYYNIYYIYKYITHALYTELCYTYALEMPVSRIPTISQLCLNIFVIQCADFLRVLLI